MTDDELPPPDRCMELLNAFYSSSAGWTSHRARKARLDHFGDEIAEDDIYYSRDAFFGRGIELTVKSIGKLYECLFGGDRRLLAAAEDVIEEREEERLAYEAEISGYVAEVLMPKPKKRKPGQKERDDQED